MNQSQEKEKEEEEGDKKDEETEESILDLFDSICFSFGDQDAIVIHDSSSPAHVGAAADNDSSSLTLSSFGDNNPSQICYLELQEYSKDVASQLLHRFRPSFVLIDCLDHAAAELVSILACMRIGVPFVPISSENTSLARFHDMVEALRQSSNSKEQQPQNWSQHECIKSCADSSTNAIAAIVCCQDDQDPIVGIFAQVQVHQLLFVDYLGNLQERIHVRNDLPQFTTSSLPRNDNLYILATSGTTNTTSTTDTSTKSLPKLVVGSHRSTVRRLLWFRDHFPPSPRIGRRTKLTFVDGITELLGAILFPPSFHQQQLLIALRNPKDLQRVGIAALLEAKVTQLTLLPSQLAQILLLPQDRLNCLERVLISGEPCPAALLDQFVQRLPNATLLNLYGQTESSGDVTCAILTDMPRDVAVVQNVVAVGRPILPSIFISTRLPTTPLENNTLKDSTLKGDESPKEILIQGNLSNGYWNFSQGGTTKSMTTFATGDVGFCRNGIWYIQGRTDQAYKLNGVWTFPTEIESEFAKFYNLHGVVVATIWNNRIYILLQQQDSSSCSHNNKNNSITTAFSRQRMKDAGLPWNLIPHEILFHSGPIPKKDSNGGAAKIDRQAIKEIVRRMVEKETLSTSMSTNCQDSFEHILNQVLQLKPNLPVASDDFEGHGYADLTKSFVDLGGDSRTAVSFLYLLSQKFDSMRVNAIDILQCDSLADLKAAVECGTPLPKRQRTERQDPMEGTLQPYPLESRKVLTISDGHLAIPFFACVDAPPLIHTQNGVTSVFAACQAGLVQRMNVMDVSGELSISIVASRHFPGWMIQAGLLVVCHECNHVRCESLIVCCYQRDSTNSMVTSLSLDLNQIRWQKFFSDGQIKGTPMVNGCHIWVSFGHHVVSLMIDSGESTFQCRLPLETATQPIALTRKVAYASCEYDSGLMILDLDHEASCLIHFSEIIGPVYKNATQLSDRTFLLTDSYGSIHHINFDDPSLNSSQMVSKSGKPLTSACIIQSDHLIVVGSYDSMVYGLSLRDKWKLLWTCNVHAAVFASPARITDSLVLVCTTAGDMILIDTQNGNPIRNERISHGEIWSNPVQVNNSTFAVGSRDSRLHILRSSL